MLKRFGFILLIASFVLPTFAQDAVMTANFTDECVTDYDASVDYFPEKAEIEYAEGFTVEYFDNYKVVTIVPWVGAEETRTYILVQCGTDAPVDMEADAVVTVPVERVVTLSTTILPHIVSQDLLDHLVGVDTLAFTSTPEILDLSDEIAEVGSGFSGFNLEVLLEIEPDLIMGQQFFSGDTAFEPISETGLAVVLNSDFADTSPLAAAEWGKYLSLFFNTEALANEAFEAVETDYNDLVDLASTAETQPTVIAATPYQGSWFMPAGDSTVAQLITDAGGDFLFSDLEGTSVVLSLEEVLEQGGSAEYWVNLNQMWLTVDEMLADDERYSEFDAFENGNVWNNNLAQNEMGGNDYFETGFTNPNLILADLIAILHPELLPDHEFNLYRPLTEAE
ncbi:MAG: ABC transporter substrate-binding protein [Phototrophicaceae bacterium]